MGTAKDNSNDMVAKGRVSKTSGKSKLTRQQVERIRQLYNPEENSYRVIGKEFSISPRMVGAIINHETWK